MMFITIDTKISNLIFQIYNNTCIEVYFNKICLLNEKKFFMIKNSQKRIMIKIKTAFFLNILYFRLLYGVFLNSENNFYTKLYKDTYLLTLKYNYKPFFNAHLAIRHHVEKICFLSNEFIIAFYVGKKKEMHKVVTYFEKNNLNKIKIKFSNLYFYKNTNLKYLKTTNEYGKKNIKCFHSIQNLLNTSYYEHNTYKKMHKSTKFFGKINTRILKLIGDIPQSGILPSEKTLFIRKLNPLTSEEDLRYLFMEFGKIISIKIITDKHTGISLNYGFIEFFSKKNCENAIFNLNDCTLDDCRISLDFCQSVFSKS